MSNPKEWTLMFYLACDNALAPAVVTQLKALKQAGYHPDVNVVAQFDPQTPETPTHVFDVNLVNKLKNPGKPNVGFGGNDPYVRTLMEDKLWRGDERGRDREPIRDVLKRNFGKKGIAYDPPTPLPRAEPAKAGAPLKDWETGPKESLSNFLTLCAEKYKARNYMLFILGHGIAVGNDIFLFDEHTDSDENALSLAGLRDVLGDFSKAVRSEGSEFQLVSFHSCSVSSLEVAYQLQYDDGGQSKGVARYMLASQGPAFVGSWPYWNILVRVFNGVHRRGAANVRELVRDIFYFVLYNSTDFVLAGYSFQLTLCDLDKVADVTPDLRPLSEDLVAGLRKPPIRNLILLAHLKAISYWGENYTDLFDFCFSLGYLCREFAKSVGEAAGLGELAARIASDCDRVKGKLVAGVEGKDDVLVVRTDFAGPSYQYSHGLSVFFPWVPPSKEFMEKTYNEYTFKVTSWHEFLRKYFKETMRLTRRQELGAAAPAQTEEQMLQEDIVSLCFNNEGPLNASNALSDGPKPPKTDPHDPLGDGSTCAAIKNYPHDTRPPREKSRQAVDDALPLSGNFFSQF